MSRKKRRKQARAKNPLIHCLNVKTAYSRENVKLTRYI